MHDTAGLFPRIQPPEAVKPCQEEQPVKIKKNAEPKVKTKKEESPLPEGIITIGDFQKVQLRVARVLTAERVENADKLLALTIDLGNGDVRPLVAGIALFYAPESLIGKNITVVANLQPVTIRKRESRGMLLAVRTGDKLTLLMPDASCNPGDTIG
jgi:methionyl-tRNA synthetase